MRSAPWLLPALPVLLMSCGDSLAAQSPDWQLAIGGNFGGAISPNLTFPQDMLVDYVRVVPGAQGTRRI